MNIAVNTKLSGEYNLVITKPDGTKTETGWFDNLILNQGLDRLGIDSGQINYVQVGTGSTTPANTQTSLSVFLAGSSQLTTANSVINSGSPLYQTSYTFNFTFSVGAVSGSITEIGVGWGSSGATLFSRALIVDSNDVPVSVPITAEDQLSVYYKITVSPVLTDTTGTLSIASIPYTYRVRVAQVGSFGVQPFVFNGNFSKAFDATTYTTGATLGTITGYPGGAAATSLPAAALVPYVNGNYYRDATWTSSSAHTNPIQAILFNWTQNSGYFAYQLYFDTPIPKSATNTFSIIMRFSWSR